MSRWRQWFYEHVGEPPMIVENVVLVLLVVFMIGVVTFAYDPLAGLVTLVCVGFPLWWSRL